MFKLTLSTIVFCMILSSCASSVRFSDSDNGERGTISADRSKSSDESNSNTKTGKATLLPKGTTFRGQASYYHNKFQGKQTANGEIYDQNKLTAAHRTLAFGTKLKVTNLKNGKQIFVIVNDRGPFVEGRVIDLSRLAAEKLGMIDDGIADVECEVME